MRPWLISEITLLLVFANATPVVLSLLLGDRWNRPLDGGRLFADGRPWLGHSKTVRGLVGSITVCAILAPAVDLNLPQGAAFGALAMLGDLGSSFCKRRLGYPSGHPVPLLDQIPEALLPLCCIILPTLAVTATEIILAIGAFIFLDLLFSRLLRSYRAHCS